MNLSFQIAPNLAMNFINVIVLRAYQATINKDF